MSDRVTMEDLRALGFCSRGARTWCEQYGFAWLDLVHDGLDAQAVENTGDHFGQQAAQQARKRAQGGSE